MKVNYWYWEKGTRYWWQMTTAIPGSNDFLFVRDAGRVARTDVDGKGKELDTGHELELDPKSEQQYRPTTVGELRTWLQRWDEGDRVALSFEQRTATDPEAACTGIVVNANGGGTGNFLLENE